MIDGDPDNSSRASDEVGSLAFDRELPAIGNSNEPVRDGLVGSEQVCRSRQAGGGSGVEDPSKRTSTDAACISSDVALLDQFSQVWTSFDFDVLSHIGFLLLSHLTLHRLQEFGKADFVETVTLWMSALLLWKLQLVLADAARILERGLVGIAGAVRLGISLASFLGSGASRGRIVSTSSLGIEGGQSVSAAEGDGGLDVVDDRGELDQLWLLETQVCS